MDYSGLRHAASLEFRYPISRLNCFGPGRASPRRFEAVSTHSIRSHFLALRANGAIKWQVSRSVPAGFPPGATTQVMQKLKGLLSSEYRTPVSRRAMARHNLGVVRACRATAGRAACATAVPIGSSCAEGTRLGD